MTLPRHVHVTLTEREAAALRRAAGNTVDHDDALEAVLLDPHNQQAAVRAYNKLRAAQQSPRPAGQQPVFLTVAQLRTLLSAADELLVPAEANSLGEGDFTGWTWSRVDAVKQATDALRPQLRQAGGTG